MKLKSSSRGRVELKEIRMEVEREGLNEAPHLRSSTSLDSFPSEESPISRNFPTLSCIHFQWTYARHENFIDPFNRGLYAFTELLIELNRREGADFPASQ